MIDVAHHGDHRWTGHTIALVLGSFNGLDRLFLVAHLGSLGPELASQIDRHFDVERLVDGGENLALKERFDDETGLDAELVGELLEKNREGTISPAELEWLQKCVVMGELVDLMKSEATLVLKRKSKRQAV